jgi:hypothetical protein
VTKSLTEVERCLKIDIVMGEGGGSIGVVECDQLNWKLDGWKVMALFDVLSFGQAHNIRFDMDSH